MKPIFSNPSELASYFSFTLKTDADSMRLAKAWKLYITDYKGDGCMGCVSEMLSATKSSVKATISNAGRADCFLRFRTASGAVIPVSFERKTNGGRIQTIETDFSKAEHIVGKFVVYSLDLCNSTTQNKRRFVPAVVIPRDLFISKLTEFGALKTVRHNGVIDGVAIQPSNKAWYEWLLDYPIVYDRNAIYTEDDFEGLS